MFGRDTGTSAFVTLRPAHAGVISGLMEWIVILKWFRARNLRGESLEDKIDNVMAIIVFPSIIMNSKEADHSRYDSEVDSYS